MSRVMGECADLAEFLTRLIYISKGAAGISVTVSFKEEYRTYQFGMDERDLKISSGLLAQLADMGDTLH